jgi:hypothetical protein
MPHITGLQCRERRIPRPGWSWCYRSGEGRAVRLCRMLPPSRSSSFNTEALVAEKARRPAATIFTRRSHRSSPFASSLPRRQRLRLLPSARRRL